MSRPRQRACHKARTNLSTLQRWCQPAPRSLRATRRTLTEWRNRLAADELPDLVTKAEALRSAASTAQQAITAMNATVEEFEQAYPGRNVDHAVCGLAQVVILEDDDNPGERDAPRGGFAFPRVLLFLLRDRAYRRD